MQYLLSFWRYIFQRASEPSTFAGIAAVVQAFQHKDYAGGLQTALGVIAILIPEAKANGSAK